MPIELEMFSVWAFPAVEKKGRAEITGLRAVRALGLEIDDLGERRAPAHKERERKDRRLPGRPHKCRAHLSSSAGREH